MEEVEEDGVVVHWRYVNLSRSLNMHYSLGSIGFGKQATHEAHWGALGQSLEEWCSQKQQSLGGKLAPLEWPKGVFEVRIVRWRWLSRITKSCLTRSRG